MSTQEHNLKDVFAAETNRLVAERVPLGALAFMAVLAAAWIFEHRSHPERDGLFALIYAAEGVCLCAAVLMLRRTRWRAHSQVIVAGAALALIVLMGSYHVLVYGEAEILAMALLYLVTGTMLLLPWGWQGQLPVAVVAVLTYCVVVWHGVHISTPLPISLLGLGTISALSVGGAAFLARYRLAFLRQAAALQAANVALAQANETKNQFLAGVSHELRTPLSVIMGYTELLLEGDLGALSPDAHEVLGRVARTSHNLAYLINDLLDLARIEAGRLEVNVRAVELAPVFMEMGQFVESRLDTKDVQFRSQLPNALKVTADRDRLVQILVNLLSNAAKFTDHGEIELSAEIATEGKVVITVRDTGCGIDDAELPRIFEPFSQGRVGKNRGGVGIGLSVSGHLAQAMGGELSATSQVGRGSTFVLRLPIAGA